MVELFLNWFLPTLAIISAIGVIPLCWYFLTFLFNTIDDIAINIREYKEEKRIVELLTTRWVLRKVEVCPNPDYLSFTYENLKYHKMLTVSNDKYEAKRMRKSNE